jgi:hypothetical protein
LIGQVVTAFPAAGVQTHGARYCMVNPSGRSQPQGSDQQVEPGLLANVLH